MKVAEIFRAWFEFCLECFLLGDDPYSGSILLQGPPKVGKSMFCRNFVRRSWILGRPLVYVTTDEEPDQLRGELVSMVGKKDDVRIVDCYTWRLGVEAKEGTFAASPADLSDLSRTMQKAMGDLDRPSVVVDSISSIALDAGEDSTLKYLRLLIPRIRTKRSFGLFTVSEGLHSPTFLNALRAIFDSIVEMKIGEGPHGVERLVRVFAAKAESPMGGGWTTFKVTEKGIVIGSPQWRRKVQWRDIVVDVERLTDYYRKRYLPLRDYYVPLLDRSSRYDARKVGRLEEVRRLAAIMFTDVVGYAALTQASEEVALELLEEHREILRPIIERYNGIEIKTIGDSFLVEFGSALEATRCAVEIQKVVGQRNRSLPQEKTLQIRIGLHLGDVIHSGGDIYGDAVNIASRIEPLAEREGICLSRQVRDQVYDKIGLPIISVGEHKLKNLRGPIEVYRLGLSGEERGSAERERG